MIVRRLLVALALVVTAVGLRPAAVDAQYFGRNKVMYDDFDFRVLRTDHFDIHYYDADAEVAVRDFGRMAERWYDRLGRAFQHQFEERKPILVYRNQPDFQQTNAISGFLSQATGGVTESVKNRVILPFAQSYDETDHVLGHELVHAFQYDLAATRSGGGATAIGRTPLWVIEGLAEYLSVGRTDAHTAMWMRDAVLREDLPEIGDLVNPQEYFPYRYGHAVWAYIAGRWGDDVVGDLYRTLNERAFAGAVELVLRMPVDTLSAEWRRDTRVYFEPRLEGRVPPSEMEGVVLRAGSDGGEVNLSPQLSPNGERMVVLSQQDPFSIDLFVVDAETGEVERQLASANSNPHFEALAFTNTSGAWSPDGESFAFVTYDQGENEIAIADVSSGNVEETYAVDGLGAVFGLAWSPGGERIAFSGSDGGVTDLYLLDLSSRDIEALTDDRYAEWHPEWSPDGSTLVFATDRGPATDLDILQFGEPGLGFLDVATGETEVRRYVDSKHIDPAFGPDGQSLYFVADPDGFPNVYRVDLESGRVFQVTDVATGVSGLTDMAPAMSVASETGRLAFTVFDDGGYSVFARESGEATGQPVDVRAQRAGEGVLPPPQQSGLELVTRYLNAPREGLPSTPRWEVDDYDPDLALDYVAQPTAGVAVDQFGTSFGGSVAAFFSDMLGNHQLGIGVSANGRVQDIGGEFIYVDRGDRVNWGLSGGRIPQRTAFARAGTTEIDGGTQARTVDLLISRRILNRASLLVEYPLSQTQRFEGQVGGTRISFDREIQREIVLGGQVVDRRELEVQDPSSINLATGMLAWVQDNSIFGFTSPVDGGRMRVEAEGNVGTLDFVNGLADMREYLFFEPFTFAVRGLHFGRYGPDAEDERLSPLFLGQGTLVRGYSINSFTGSECTAMPDAPTTCPEFDRLVGSRVAVVNAELRVPLFGTEQFGLINFPYIPTELSFFGDVGVAWTSTESPEIGFEQRTTDRVPVFSVGSSLRFNVLGRMVFELYYAHPFQRPGAGGQWGFQVAPGW